MARLLYAIAVLGVDTAMAYTNHRIEIGDFDVFKAVFWLFVPLVWERRTLEREWYGTRRLARADWALLIGIAAVGAAAILVIPHVPSLRDTYQPIKGGWGLVRAQAIWTISWLPGWEFLHRYFLLRAWEKQWWVVVVLETAYHLQKPVPEMLGMAALSAVLTYWTIRRRNALPALLVHLAIEASLIAFLAL